MHYPFIRHLSQAEIDKTALVTRPMARKVIEVVHKARDAKGSGVKVIVFVDDRYCTSLELARQLIRENKIKEEPVIEITQVPEITNIDYMKLSILYEGNFRDKIIADNNEFYSKMSEDLLSRDLFEMLEPHKYDYKCFPIFHLKG